MINLVTNATNVRSMATISKSINLIFNAIVLKGTVTISMNVTLEDQIIESYMLKLLKMVVITQIVYY